MEIAFVFCLHKSDGLLQRWDHWEIILYSGDNSSSLNTTTENNYLFSLLKTSTKCKEKSKFLQCAGLKYRFDPQLSLLRSDVMITTTTEGRRALQASSARLGAEYNYCSARSKRSFNRQGGHAWRMHSKPWPPSPIPSTLVRILVLVFNS